MTRRRSLVRVQYGPLTWQPGHRAGLFVYVGAQHVKAPDGALRDELLNGEIFYTVAEARVLIERWREHYNRVRPHSALGSAHRHRRRSLLDRPPLRSGPSSSGFRIGRLLRKLWTQQRGKVTSERGSTAHSATSAPRHSTRPREPDRIKTDVHGSCGSPDTGGLRGDVPGAACAPARCARPRCGTARHARGNYNAPTLIRGGPMRATPSHRRARHGQLPCTDSHQGSPMRATPSRGL